ncbi:hypothetical protein BN126_3151 [Cronobacter sakazakii 680]|nr:hypothetical protein BN126_3151 [Cronobacter sakazakii 680]
MLCHDKGELRLAFFIALYRSEIKKASPGPLFFIYLKNDRIRRFIPNRYP